MASVMPGFRMKNMYVCVVIDFETVSEVIQPLEWLICKMIQFN